ncbi:MAG: YfdX family protein [Cyanobacteria bacterium]|nr:YfdX family protein [Cyanobacteriota bacterium]
MDRIRLMVIGLTSSLSLTSGSVYCVAAPKISSEVSAVPHSTLSPQEEESVSLAADRLLIHTNLARIALKGKDVGKAKKEVDQALVLGRMIKHVMPTYAVNTKLSAGSHKYTHQEKVQPLLVTVHEELTTETVLEPVYAAKGELSKKGASGHVTADVNLHSTTAQLDANFALMSLERAKKAISENKLDVANTALRGIQSSVILHYFVTDLPLQKAQTNLMIARELIKSGKVEEGKAALKVATDSLSDYEKTVNTKSAKASADLRKEIDKLSSSLQPKDNKASQDAITKMWQTVSGWFK